MVEITNENLFFDKLKTGINLFTGAGFSVLEAPNGVKVPDSQTLCKDLCEQFSLNASYSDDLEKVSSVQKRN